MWRSHNELFPPFPLAGIFLAHSKENAVVALRMESFWLNCLPFPHPTALFGDENNVDESKFDIPAENEIMKSMSGENDGSAVLSSIRSIEAISVAEMSLMPLPPWKRKGAKKTAVGNNLDVVISGAPCVFSPRQSPIQMERYQMLFPWLYLMMAELGRRLLVNLQ